MNDEEAGREFRERGFVMQESAFTDSEVAAIRAEVMRLERLDIPQRLREIDSDLIRAMYGVHDLSPLLGRLTRDPRLVCLTERLLDSQVYLYQTQVSPKKAFGGNAWPWHQDFLYWSRDDGMPASDVVSAAILLDDVTEFNGPLFVVDGSHKLDLQADTSTEGLGWERTARTGDKYQVAPGVLSGILDRLPVTSLKAPAGALVMLHGALLHCSPPNLSGQPRTILFVRYNAIGNTLPEVDDPRPEWLANRHPEVVSPLDAAFMTAG